MLAGHDMQKPLASTEAGSLTLRDGEDALHIEARVAPTTSWAADALAALAAGLTKGLSPGFQVPPGGDVVTRSADGLLRTVTRADLFEISMVTRPAYDAAQIAARNWQVPPYIGKSERQSTARSESLEAMMATTIKQDEGLPESLSRRAGRSIDGRRGAGPEHDLAEARILHRLSLDRAPGDVDR